MTIKKHISQLREGDKLAGPAGYTCLEDVRDYGDGSFAVRVQYKDGGIGIREWDEFANNPEVHIES